MSTPTSVCFVAGRSGGHLLPALTLAQQLHVQGITTHLITTNTTLDHRIAKGVSWIAHHKALSVNNISKNPLKLLWFVAQCIVAGMKSFLFLRKHNVQKVVTTGGYIALPVCWAAWVQRIPIEAYELNAVPGKATTFLARFASKIYVCFEQTKKYFSADRCEYAPYPIRFAKPASADQAQAITELKLSHAKKTVFINGGSQGSLFLNRMIKEWIELNPHIHALIQIIHQAGSADQVASLKQLYQLHEISAHVFDYSDAIKTYYNAADIIICRAGAGSLFEALHFEKICIVIPLEIKSTSHQKDNALAMMHKYPALFSVLTEAELNKNNTLFFSAINKRIHAQAKAAAQLREVAL